MMALADERVGLLSKIRVMFSVHYAEMLTYRAEIALWAVATMQPLIMMGIWAEAAGSGKFGFTTVDAMRYFIVVYLVRQVTVVWTIYHFEWLVVTGRLSPMLLHPIDPSIRFIFMHLGEQWTRLPFALLFAGLFLVAYPQIVTGGPGGELWWPGLGNILLAVFFSYFAFILLFYMQYTLCMAAFWYERVAAMESLIFLPYMFFSGMIFPFEVLPDTARELLLWTPYPYMVWFPASLAVHGEAPIIKGLLIMTCWLVVFYGLSRWLWHKGLKHYSAMGA